jgi:hypothetical protein
MLSLLRLVFFTSPIRAARKQYRRQWDPPKKGPAAPADDSDDELSIEAASPMAEVENAARVALTTMYLKTTR